MVHSRTKAWAITMVGVAVGYIVWVLVVLAALIVTAVRTGPTRGSDS